MGSKKKKLISGITLAIACAFIWYGAARGEITVVLNKAVNICLECIGLG